jgi:protein-L-isoaspartate(D-aspartate) O-methyltransferase
MTTTTAATPDELRARMIDTLVSQIQPSEETVRALRVVPRHLFLPGIELDRVYGGGAIPTRHDEKGSPISSSSEVAIMAMMLDALRLERGQRVLEIGAGTGYNAAILTEMAGDGVVTVDLDPEIAAEAREHLRAAGYPQIRVEAADGWLGWSDAAPYGRIEVTASAADISPHWVDQLEEGGLIVAPLRLRPNAQAIVALRKRGRVLESTRVFAGGFMWLRGLGGVDDPTREIDGWRLTLSRQIDEARVAGLLRETPKVELIDALSWSELALFALTEPDSFTLSRKTPPGQAQGLLGEDGVAVVEWASGIVAPRMLLTTFGAPAAGLRLRQRLDAVRGQPFHGLRITAVPSGDQPPHGDVVFAQEHYTFVVSRAA